MGQTIRGLTALLVFVAAVATAFEVGVLQYVSGGGRPPVLDEWYYTDPATYLANLFERHNGHPLLFGRLILAADFYFAEASGDFARFLSSLFGVAQAVAFTGLAALLGFRQRLTLASVFAFSIIAAFNPFGADNLTLAFQATFVLAFAMAPACFLALAFYANKPSKARFAAVLAAALIATQTLAIGILLPPFMLAAAWRSGLSSRIIAALFAAAIIGGGAYFLSPISAIWDSEAAFGPADKMPAGMAFFALKAIGASVMTPIVVVLRSGGLVVETDIASLVAGCVLTTLIAAFGVSVLCRRQAQPSEVALAMLGAFSLASVAALAYARSVGPFGGAFWEASKYSPFGALALCTAGLMVLCIFDMRRRPGVGRRGV